MVVDDMGGLQLTRVVLKCEIDDSCMMYEICSLRLSIEIREDARMMLIERMRVAIYLSPSLRCFNLLA